MIRNFNEDSRVKIPALVHLTRLGYEYLSIKDDNIKNSIDPSTNIFKHIFRESINYINNTDFDDKKIDDLIFELSVKLKQDDLGRSFYELLINGYNGIRLIDFDDINKNKMSIVTELTYRNGDDEFRPDIIVLINGMPLSFIEVKKPNNIDGILAERNRINTRFKNKKFRKFANITQLLVFSNNQPYNDDSTVPISGAFYGTPSYDDVFFNLFREEQKEIYNDILNKDSIVEDTILKDNNYVSIKGAAEYNTNLSPTTPTNSILTSLFHKNRFFKLLKYGIAYVEKVNKDGVTILQKHIMRYQQLFATLAIEKKINEGMSKGIIWHTQGSGKTALAYYNVKYLTDYFQKQNKVAKFYFIVDRLSLLDQACDEFNARGLYTSRVNSKDEFAKSIKEISAVSKTGQININVVNIQKFSEESFTKEADYNVNVQRIYFLDEAHRSYNPQGSFLANLLASDTNAIKIALTGTPIVSEKFKTKDIFGEYIHTYYYNKSIEDGYTLKLIREGIETSYRTKLNETFEDIKKNNPGIKEGDIFAMPQFARDITEYIVKDFLNSRLIYKDGENIGGMIVCDSSQQARNIFKELNNYSQLTKALILHDEDDTEYRKQEVEDFKSGKIDILVVYKMLLTGFDSPRLKKIYLNRIIKAHNLLQTLTRVNRPYKSFRFGYVVDFADIKDEFDKTNEVYFKELQAELGEDFEHYKSIFLSQEEIEDALEDINKRLVQFDTDNLEIFTSEINELSKKELFDIKNLITKYKELFNVVRSFNFSNQYSKMTKTLPIDRVNKMIREVDRRIKTINLTQNANEENINILNVVFQDIEFNFKKISSEELNVSDSYKKVLDEVREEFVSNIDKDDMEYIDLYNSFKNYIISSNIEDISASEMKKNIEELNKLKNKIHSLNAKNTRYLNKYLDDEKYVKIHKRVLDKICDFDEIKLFEILLNLKEVIDNTILQQEQIINNESYFKSTVMQDVVEVFDESGESYQISTVDYFADLIVEIYLLERRFSLND